MKIAMIVRSFSEKGGLELYTHKLVEGLLQQGLFLTVICDHNDSPLRHPNLNIVQWPPLKRSANKVERINHYFREATLAVKKYGPFDIVHSQHLGLEYPDVVTFHNHTVSRLSRCGKAWEVIANKWKCHFRSDYKKQQAMDSLLTKQGRVLIFPSNACQQDFIDEFPFLRDRDPALLVVAYPGSAIGSENSTEVPDEIKQNCFEGKQDNGKPFVFLFVGRGYRKKGLDTLLSACQNLKKQGSNFRLLIAGLPEKPILNWRLKTLGLSKNIFFLGFCKNMSLLYKRASSIILPSRIEPFGMAPFQAMQYGLVPIVSRVCGCAELLSHGKDSLILSNHLDSEELARHMKNLMDNQGLLRTLSLNAKEKANEINWQKTVEATITAYNRVLSINKYETMRTGK